MQGVPLISVGQKELLSEHKKWEVGIFFCVYQI